MAKLQYVTQLLYNLVVKDDPIRLTAGPTEGVLLYQNSGTYKVARIVGDGFLVDITEFVTLEEAQTAYDDLVAQVV